MFRSIFLALALSASLALPSAAQEAPLRWGMSPDEVLAAAPGGRAVTRGETLDAGQVRVSARDEVAGVSGSSRFFFSTEGLSLIEFSVRDRDCRTLAAALLEAEGQPLRISDQGILRLVIWHDEANDQRLRLMTSIGICSLYREPLADYRDIDLADR